MRPRAQGIPSSASAHNPASDLPRPASAKLGWAILPAIAIAAATACSGAGSIDSEESVGEAQSAASCPTPVGLALQVENGAGLPLQVRAGQTFYVNQIDIRAAVQTNVDDGVAPLAQQGDFAGLNWDDAALSDTDVAQMPNPDGTFIRRRYYENATWMKAKSSFTLEQLDAQNNVVGPAITLDIGQGNNVKKKDDFFVRRLRAIQWTRDCVSPASCAGATQFEAEALVEVRNASSAKPSFTVAPSTTSLRLKWSARPGAGYVIPVTQVAAPQYDYGFTIDLDVLTPPGPGGVYAPGSDVTIQTTLRDGSGNRLHAPGVLPSFFEASFGPNAAGIQYYRGFFDPTITFYRRKHLERMMVAQMVGPLQDLQPIRNVVEIWQLLGDDPVAHVGFPSRDGYFGDVVTFPRTNALFGGAFDPSHAAWGAPVSDTWTHHIPDDAAPGTYQVTLKARRAYLGEDLAASKTIDIQVGSPVPTAPPAPVGNCGSCHSGGGSLGQVLHANDDLGTCNGCHAPLAIEHDSPVYVRTHFIHSRTGRYEAPLHKCAECHNTVESIQRTSKSACLSCHTSYPQWHEQQFGPITSPYVGGGAESFNVCTTACHTDHPGSGLKSKPKKK